MGHYADPTNIDFNCKASICFQPVGKSLDLIHTCSKCFSFKQIYQHYYKSQPH